MGPTKSEIKSAVKKLRALRKDFQYELKEEIRESKDPELREDIDLIRTYKKFLKQLQLVIKYVKKKDVRLLKVMGKIPSELRDEILDCFPRRWFGKSKF